MSDQTVGPRINELLAVEAAKWVGVKEVGGDNKGPEVEMFQKSVNGIAVGQSWCMDFMQYCIKAVEKEFSLTSPIFRSEHVLTVWNKSPVSMRSTAPEVGYLMFWQHVGTSNGHVGVVTRVGPKAGVVSTIEGNTGDGEGVVREGDGVYRRLRACEGTVKMKVLGYMKVFDETPSKT